MNLGWGWGGKLVDDGYTCWPPEKRLITILN